MDTNLSPDWTSTLGQAGHDAVHWSQVGRADAPDEDILKWASAQDCVILTSDLDFGTALATTGAVEPSVVQLRTGTTLPSRIGPLVVRVLRETESDLSSGALVTVEDDRVRLRRLTFEVKR